MGSNIRNSPSYSTLKKKILSFIRPLSNDVFNVSHPKRLIFLTRLCVGLSHLREHKFKHSFLNTINPMSKRWITSFSTAQDSLMKDKTFCLILKESSPKFLEKPTLVLHQYFFVAIQVFQLNLTPTYSAYQLITYYRQKGLNLLNS